MFCRKRKHKTKTIAVTFRCLLCCNVAQLNTGSTSFPQIPMHALRCRLSTYSFCDTDFNSILGLVSS